jgi:serine/threonine protein kinase
MMVGQDGRVHLLLFGISKYRPGREQAASGTEGYAPPEQYFGYTDARSDVYSLGATLHHLLTRRDPRQEILFVNNLSYIQRPDQIIVIIHISL